MNSASLIFLFLLSNTFFSGAKALTCGERQIDNCKECGKGNQSDTCAVCEDNYFPLLKNLYCFSCEDPIYGQEGCKGGCIFKNNSNYSVYVSCPECKEGYFNKDGICFKCDYNSTGCLECSYNTEESSEDKRFKCLKCSSEEGYRLNKDHKCVKCDDFVYNCKKCHFIGDEGTESECDECPYYHYKSSNRECSYCSGFDNGNCYSCSPANYGFNYENCSCKSGYTLKKTSCVECPTNCDECEYDEKADSIKCLKCNPSYIFNNTKNCVKCEQDGCNYCSLNENNKQVCLDCGKGQFIAEGKICSLPSDICLDYEYDNFSKDKVCIECKSPYIIETEEHKCIKCSDIPGSLGNCETCLYDHSSKQYKCLSCKTSIDSMQEYTYINNIFDCISKNELVGCEVAEFISNSRKYECLKCKNNRKKQFIKVKDDKSCVEQSISLLSSYCLEAERKGESYSCLECFTNFTLVEDSTTQTKNCFPSKDSLSFCLKGEFKNQKYTCTKCVNNASLKDNKCSCNSDSFSMDNISCYKCNDEELGNPGCDESEGCEYVNDKKKLTCKKCKDGYYKDSKGECSLCSNSIHNCNKCHYDEVKQKSVCDSCINSIYFLNSTTNKCELNDCEEYPDISPGCIICKDKLSQYKENKKCQTCKYGYFKTKDEKCVYCSSEKYGGPGCHECGYEINEQGTETNKIICKGCYSGLNLEYKYEYFEGNKYYSPKFDSNIKSPLLSKSGKCYDCKIQFSDTCKECQLVDDEGTEILKCITCNDGYYLTPEGQCENIIDLIPKIPNCIEYMFSSQDIKFKLSFNKDNVTFKIYNYSNYDEVSKAIYNGDLGTIKKTCLKCKDGFFANEEGKCEKLSYDKCTFNSIMNNFNMLYKFCRNFCMGNDNNVNIYMVSNDLKNSENVYFTISNLFSRNYYYYINYFDFFQTPEKIPACMSNSGEGGQYAPENLKNCVSAYYFLSNKTYVCMDCYVGYYFDSISNLCILELEGQKSDIPSYCTFINLGTEKMPDYTCEESYYRHMKFTLVTNENGRKIYKKDVTTGCSEAIEDTTYTDTKYNCTKCPYNYIPYYSNYYKSIICQSLTSEIIKEEIFDNDYRAIEINAYNEICQKDNFFMPNEDYCYKCDDLIVGMRGCKGSCTYSNKTENALRCTGECKKGYFESSEGVCSSCNSFNKGCYECHYENEYPSNYKGIRRKRRFVCDYCEDGYIQSLSGECVENIEVRLANCAKGKIDSNNRYICTQCEENYFVNEKGKCEKCDASHFKGKNKCIECDNTSEGGIDNCEYCETDNDKPICTKCLFGYILSSTENSCLPFTKNKELENFSNCEKVTKENNKYVCSRCKKDYTLIKKNNKKECIYARTLYDSNFEKDYLAHLYITDRGIEKYKGYSNYMDSDIIYKRYKNYYPCQEAENLGTEENPLYSCIKCYEFFNASEEYKPYLKINEINSNISYCFFLDNDDYYYLHNCLEATMQIKNGKEIINCTQCDKYYYLSYNDYYESFTCQYTAPKIGCSVHYCKTCKIHDGNTCEECLPGYEVNSLTGSCMEITKEIPSITWKDIYNLNIYNPSIKIRGVTKSQINEGHAFLIYFIFKKKQNIRFLEGEDETIKMDGICTIENPVDESNDIENVVDYNCNGNNKEKIELNNYSLDLIEDGNNEKLLKSSNLDALVYEIKENRGSLDYLEYSYYSSYNPYSLILSFWSEGKKNFEAEEYFFDIKIEGTISKDVTNIDPIYTQFYLNEVNDTRASCIFTIGSNQNANLTCTLNVEKYKDIKTFSFQTKKIITSNYEIYLEDLDTISLINSGEKKSGKSVNKDLLIKIAIYGGPTIGGVLLLYLIIGLIKSKKAKKLPFALESGINPINNMNKMNNINGMNNMNNMNNINNRNNGNQQGYALTGVESTSTRGKSKSGSAQPGINVNKKGKSAINRGKMKRKK